MSFPKSSFAQTPRRERPLRLVPGMRHGPQAHPSGLEGRGRDLPGKLRGGGCRQAAHLLRGHHPTLPARYGDAAASRPLEGRGRRRRPHPGGRAANALLKILEEPPPTRSAFPRPAPKKSLPKTVVSRPVSRSLSRRSRRRNSGNIGRTDSPPPRASASPSFRTDPRERRGTFQTPGWPESLIQTPLSPFEAAESLPGSGERPRGGGTWDFSALSQGLRTRLRTGRHVSLRRIRVVRSIPATLAAQAPRLGCSRTRTCVRLRSLRGASLRAA